MSRTSKEDRKTLSEQAEEKLSTAKTSSEEALEDLQSQFTEDVPGLDLSSAVDNYVEEEFKTDLDACKTSEERTAMKEKLAKHYTKGNGKKFIQGVINKLKTSFGQVKTAFKDLASQISGIATDMVTPAVITVGQATSTANPVHATLDAKAKVGAIKAAVMGVCGLLLMVYQYAALIHFSLPPAVTTIQTTLTLILAALSAIPI